MDESRIPADTRDNPFPQSQPASTALGLPLPYAPDTAHEAEVGREPLVAARSLTKRYGSLTAVNEADFDVYPAEFLGFLGPNGAGKTTLMKMIYGLVEPSEGTLHVFGREVREGARAIKARLGVVAQEDNLDPDLTVWDNLMIYARYFGIDRAAVAPRARELLDLMELTPRRDKEVNTLSGGMRRRLAIVRALLNQPELVILDEPTTGLDPQVRHLIWDRLLSLKEQGITFLITTHYMEEAESLCDRLHIMDEGRVIVSGTPRELIARHVGEYALELLAAPAMEQEIARRWPELERQRSGQRLYLYAEDRETLLPLIEELTGRETRLRPASVEDVFLKLTGRGIRE